MAILVDISLIKNPNLMKKSLAIAVAIFLSLISYSQFQKPTVAWSYFDHPPGWVDGPLITIKPPSTDVPGDPLNKDDSGEDWWYDIENIIEGGEHTGYMVCGFGTWVNFLVEESNVGGCSEFDLPGLIGPDCLRPALPTETLGSKLGTIARYDLNGNMVWCKAYSFMDEGIIALAPTTEPSGSFVFVGWGASTRTLTGDQVPYNPDGGPTYDIPTEGMCSSLTSKMIVGKINLDGDLQWLNQYGFYDIDGGFGFTNEEVLGAIAIGYDLIETPSGKYRVVGRSQDLDDVGLDGGTPKAFSKFFVIDLNPDGTIDNKELIGQNGYFSGAREIEYDALNSEYYITGLQREGGFNAHDVIPNPGDAILFKIDESMSVIDIPGADSWFDGTSPHTTHIEFAINDLNSVGWDVKILNDNKVAWALFEDCMGCGTSSYNASGNQPSARILLFDDEGDVLLNEIKLADINTFGFSKQEAFDIKIGLIATQDGGFACISTFQPSEVDLETAPYNAIKADLEAQLGETCNTVGWMRANTNAYIGKFDSDGNFLWDQSFDSDPTTPANYPGDWKEQECVFRLVEAEDGSLVFVGNTSHNKDDYYIAKLNNDCHIIKEINNDFTVFDNSFFETEIDGDVTWPDDLAGTPSTITAAGTIRILFGSSLTIDGATVELADSRKMSFPTRIIVEPGGELILKNGATLTSLSECGGSMWDGVQVWGNADDEQIPDFQGKLTMTTGATIEDAVVGVTCVKRDGFVKDKDFTGGILHISDAHFINNLIGIEMWDFENEDASTGDILDNVSFIRNTEFLIDDQLNDVELANVTVFGDDPQLNIRTTEARAHQAFIFLENIRGVKIDGNDFLIDPTIVPTITNPERLGYGILSWDAQFYARALPSFPGDPNPKPNTFTNLWIGINVKPIDGVADVFIDRNEFTDNHFGIALDGNANYATITRNDFFIPQSLPTFSTAGSFEDANTGIYCASAEGLKIEGNFFDGLDQSTLGNNAGIYVENSTIGTSSEIYENEFEQLDVGIQSNFNNQGLNIDCNQFTTDESGGPVIGWHNVIDGLMLDKGDCDAGDPEAPLANRFLGTYTGGSIGILNQGTFFEYSTYDDPGFVPPSAPGVLVTECDLVPDVDLLLACPARNVPPDFPGILTEIAELADEIAILEEIFDGGDTEGLLDFIDNTSSSNTIRDELLDHSPYLTDEILLALIDKGIHESKAKQVLEANAPLTTEVLLALISSPHDYSTVNIKKLILDSSPVADEAVLVAAINRIPELSSSFLKQILEANSPLRDETLLALLNRPNPIQDSHLRDILLLNTPLSHEVDAAFMANNYPSWLQNQVNMSTFVADDPITKVPPTSAREEIEDQILHLTQRKNGQVNYLVSYYLQANDFESAVLLLEAQNTVQASCALLPLLLQTRKGTQLYDQIQILRDQASMLPDNPYAETLFALCDYYELMFEIRTQVGGFDAITPAQIAQLNSFTEIQDQVALNNLNVLEFIGEREFHELKLVPIGFGPVQKSMTSPYKELLPEEIAKIDFDLYPNPANAELHIFYHINDHSASSNIEIFDLSGKRVYQTTVNDQHNELVLRIDNYTPGFYLVQVSSQNGDRMTKKLIVQ